MIARLVGMPDGRAACRHSDDEKSGDEDPESA
jgi:hypothetical protein